jgi:hypothetical protein
LAKAKKKIKSTGQDKIPAAQLIQRVVVNASRQLLLVPGGKEINTTEVTREWCLVHNVSDISCTSVQQAVNLSITQRTKRRLLLTIPVRAPDGRELQLQLRDGEQHDVERSLALFAEAAKLDGAVITRSLRNLVEERLPPAVLRMPVDMGPTKPNLQLRISQGDNVQDVVLTFCEVFGVMHAVQSIYQAVVSKLS